MVPAFPLTLSGRHDDPAKSRVFFPTSTWRFFARRDNGYCFTRKVNNSYRRKSPLMPVDILDPCEAEVKGELPPPELNMSNAQLISFHVHGSNDSYLKVKYVADRCIGWILLTCGSPVILLLWCLVKFTSAGPGFYLQTRVGLDGEEFEIVKLRTMRQDAEKAGKPEWSSKGDPRITRVGRVLRALHLDELPQLWNVARGDMCLTGPRPERPEITKSLAKLIPNYHLRQRVKPGITGLSQVNLEPDRHINLTREKQVLDLRYINEANLWLDCRMIFATCLRMFGIKGERAMRLTGLKRTIADHELRAVGYEFNKPECELWNPNKGPA
jgi:lipopolysaccharide/colanic/teichoic acid biosynthesis glycosyltransferase